MTGNLTYRFLLKGDSGKDGKQKILHRFVEVWYIDGELDNTLRGMFEDILIKGGFGLKERLPLVVDREFANFYETGDGLHKVEMYVHDDKIFYFRYLSKVSQE